MSRRSPLTFDIGKQAPVSVKETSLRQNTQTRKHENEETKKGRAGRQFIAAHVLPEAAKQFKLMAVQQERTTQSLLIEAINDLFAKHGLSRIADE